MNNISFSNMEKWIKHNQHKLLIVFILMIISFIILVKLKLSVDISGLLLLLIWLMVTRMFHLSYQGNILTATLSMSLSYGLLFFNLKDLAKQITDFAYYLFFLALLQYLIKKSDK